MDITNWYAIALGSLIVSYIASYLFFSVASIVQRFGKYYFLKYLYYPQIPKIYLRGSGKTTWFNLPGGSGKTTRFDLLVLTAFLLTNVLALTIGINDFPGFVRRSGLLSVINLMPLFLGGQMNAIANLCGVGLRTYTRLHRWLGRIAAIEGFIHMIVRMSTHRPNFNTGPDLTGLVVAVIFLVILLSGLLRSRLYELFLNLHLILGVATVAAIYLHNPTGLLMSPTVYLLAGVCLQILIGAVRSGQVLYRNIRDLPVPDAVHVHVRLSRAWIPRAGQYVYLCIPGVSYTSFAQLHPFYVAWWYRDEGNNTTRINTGLHKVSGGNYTTGPHKTGGNDYAVFIVQKQSGFTSRLFSRLGNKFDGDTDMRAVIEGPYGKELDLDSYGTVLLFATGIGIAGQLPYVQQLLSGYHNCEVKTRRIALYWQVEKEIQTAWVADRMQVLLGEQDTDRILDIHLYVSGDFLPRVLNTSRGQIVQLGERLDITYNSMNIKEVIDSEINQRRGRTVISLCTNDEMSDEIRRLVQNMMDDSISLKELDFRPGNGVEPKLGPATV